MLVAALVLLACGTRNAADKSGSVSERDAGVRDAASLPDDSSGHGRRDAAANAEDEEDLVDGGGDPVDMSYLDAAAQRGGGVFEDADSGLGMSLSDAGSSAADGGAPSDHCTTLGTDGGTGGAVDAGLVDGGPGCQPWSLGEYSYVPPPSSRGPVDNLLVVLDRSSGMDQSPGGIKRWQVADAALRAALQGVAPDLLVGGVFFPTPGDYYCVDPTGIECQFAPMRLVPVTPCKLSPFDDPSHLAFQGVGGFLEALSSERVAPVQGGHSPLLEAMQEADAALSATLPPGTTAVVIITEGGPGCMWDQPKASALVARWAAAGIRLHVVLLDDSRTSDALFDMFATSGGVAVTNAVAVAGVTTAIRQALGLAPSPGPPPCRVLIDRRVREPDAVVLIGRVCGARQTIARDLGSGGGWSIAADATEAWLTGDLCRDTQAGRYGTVVLQHPCGP